MIFLSPKVTKIIAWVSECNERNPRYDPLNDPDPERVAHACQLLFPFRERNSLTTNTWGCGLAALPQAIICVPFRDKNSAAGGADLNIVLKIQPGGELHRTRSAKSKSGLNPPPDDELFSVVVAVPKKVLPGEKEVLYSLNSGVFNRLNASGRNGSLTRSESPNCRRREKFT